MAQTLNLPRDFEQASWDGTTADDCRQLVRLALREDLDRWYDWTTVALVPAEAQGRAKIVSRQAGVICGLRAAAVVLEEIDSRAALQDAADDGTPVEPGQVVGRMVGPARTLLTAERTVLNFIGRLSGVASLTQRYAAAVAGTKARIYDTRKTTPSWRRLEKYAVHCGGGHNHRMGLFDAVLIKDNHLAFGAGGAKGDRYSPREAVERARQFLAELGPHNGHNQLIVEVEVDTLEQFDAVLPAWPDIVLLDNMPVDQLVEAVQRRDTFLRGANALCEGGTAQRSGQPQRRIELEASGGVNLESVRRIAETGVDRISSGALTHSAQCLDVALDWE